MEQERKTDPTAILWWGDQSLPCSQPGNESAWDPCGPSTVRSNTVASCHRFAQGPFWIPYVPDLQAVWLLLWYRDGRRANSLFRAILPGTTEEYAVGTGRCDDASTDCWGLTFLTNLPFSIGRWGSRNSSQVQQPSRLVGRCLHSALARHLVLAGQIAAVLPRGEPSQHVQAAVSCREPLLDVGVEALRGKNSSKGPCPRPTILMKRTGGGSW